MKIYCHSKFGESLRKKLADALFPDHVVDFGSELDNDQARTAFRSAEAILGNPPLEWFSEPLELLKFWQLDSAGFDQYAMLQLAGHVKVANMGDWFARPCAESVVGGVLALYRGLDTLTLLKQKKEWVGANLRPSLRILYGQKVVILGAGTIGRATNAILKGLGCHTRLMARTAPDADIHTVGELLNELPETDLVINTLPGTATHFVNAAVFDAMKPGSVYASVGRGSTTDEHALIEALDSGRLYGAVLDVTEHEPLPSESPLWQMDQVILTQHTGGGHQNEHIGKIDLFLNNLFSLRNGGNIADEIMLAKGY
jgi:glyoxylate/hydroxypyruvate reductase A